MNDHLREFDMFFDDHPRLGPCCICGSEDNVTAVVMLLAIKNEMPGEGRVPIEQLTEPHEHDRNVEH